MTEFARLLSEVWPLDTPEVDSIRLAKRIGVSLSALRDWRRGTNPPRRSWLPEIAVRLEAEFGIPAQEWIDAAVASTRRLGKVEHGAQSEAGRRAVDEHFRNGEPPCEKCQEAFPMLASTRKCSNCGGPVFSSKTGICQRNPECKLLYKQAGRNRAHSYPGAYPPAAECRVCGGPLGPHNKIGICGKTEACRAAARKFHDVAYARRKKNARNPATLADALAQGWTIEPATTGPAALLTKDESASRLPR